jgi:dihydrofolate reductase
MRKLSISEFLTVDGVMQAPGLPDEDRDGGFEHGGWSANYWDVGMQDILMEWMQKMDSLLLGRRTYAIFASYWPNVKAGDPDAKVADLLNNAPKYVASRTLAEAEWNNSTILQGDVATAVAELKRQDGGEIQISGSGQLVRTLLKADLVDELLVWNFPVIVGSGKRLFSGEERAGALSLTDSYKSTTGVVLNRYERAGDIKAGSMAPKSEPAAAR